MSKPLQIVTYTPGDHSALCTFMSDLQDLEREWSSDRSPGAEMATDHIDYLLELAQRSNGQALVAKLDDQLVGLPIGHPTSRRVLVRCFVEPVPEDNRCDQLPSPLQGSDHLTTLSRDPEGHS